MLLLPGDKWQQLGLLQAQYNNLTYISSELMAQLPVLYQFKLQGNRITVQPDVTPLAPSLKILNVAYNKISEIRSDHISDLVRLEDLDLSNNHIKTFSTSIIKSLPGLIRLSLSGNKMKSFGPAITVTWPLQVSLLDNRLHCDTDMCWIKKLIDVTGSMMTISLSTDPCATPEDCAAMCCHLVECSGFYVADDQKDGLLKCVIGNEQ